MKGGLEERALDLRSIGVGSFGSATATAREPSEPLGQAGVSHEATVRVAGKSGRGWNAESASDQAV
jgi:hypothetical protein